MNAMTTSIASADSFPERNWLQRLGSPGAFVDTVLSSSGMSGSSMTSGVPSGPPTNDVHDRRRVDRICRRIDLHEFTHLCEKRVNDEQSDTDAPVVVDVSGESIGSLRRPQPGARMASDRPVR